ncbi:MAG TPA: hypothetical protein VK250_07605 [Nitrososphaeraceae archaeon]|nr:hypothetical protein [Nitrososphaeraceae archaeon]
MESANKTLTDEEMKNLAKLYWANAKRSQKKSRKLSLDKMPGEEEMESESMGKMPGEEEEMESESMGKMPGE